MRQWRAPRQPDKSASPPLQRSRDSGCPGRMAVSSCCSNSSVDLDGVSIPHDPLFHTLSSADSGGTAQCSETLRKGLSRTWTLIRSAPLTAPSALTHHSPLTGHHPLLTTHWSPGTTHHSLVTTPWSPPTAHHSLVTGHRSPLTVHHSLVTGHRSPVTGHWAPLSSHWSPAALFVSTGTCVRCSRARRAPP